MKTYTVRKARYAKNMMLVIPTESDNRFAGRVDRLCRALKGRWTHREKGYVMSPTKVKRLEVLIADGRDATLKFDSAYSAHYVLEAPSEQLLARGEVIGKALLEGLNAPPDPKFVAALRDAVGPMPTLAELQDMLGTEKKA